MRFLPFVTVAEQQRTKLYGNDFSFSFAYNTEPVKYPGQIMTYIYRNDRSLITPLFSDELTCLFLLFEDSPEKNIASSLSICIMGAQHERVPKVHGNQNAIFNF